MVVQNGLRNRLPPGDYLQKLTSKNIEKAALKQFVTSQLCERQICVWQWHSQMQEGWARAGCRHVHDCVGRSRDSTSSTLTTWWIYLSVVGECRHTVSRVDIRQIEEYQPCCYQLGQEILCMRISTHSDHLTGSHRTDWTFACLSSIGSFGIQSDFTCAVFASVGGSSS